MNKIEELLQSYCDRLNDGMKTCTPPQVRDLFQNVLDEMTDNIEHSGYYWDRTCYIANGFDFDKCWFDLFKDKDQYVVKISDDLSEHPGLVIHFKDYIKEKIGEL